MRRVVRRALHAAAIAVTLVLFVPVGLGRTGAHRSDAGAAGERPVDPPRPGADRQHPLRREGRPAARLPERDARLRHVPDLVARAVRPRPEPLGGGSRSSASSSRTRPSSGRCRATTSSCSSSTAACSARHPRGGSSCRCSASPASGSSRTRTAATRGWRRGRGRLRGLARVQRDRAGRRGSRRGGRAERLDVIRPLGGRDARLGRPRRGSAAASTGSSRFRSTSTSGGRSRRRTGDVVRVAARAEPSAVQGNALRRATRSSDYEPKASPSSSCSCRASRETRPEAAVRAGRRRGRPTLDRRVRAVRDRGHGARPAGRLLPQPALRRAPSRVGRGADRQRDARHDRRRAARGSSATVRCGRSSGVGPGVRAASPLARGRRRGARRRLSKVWSVDESGRLRRLAWQVLVYGSGRLGLQLVSLITLPILTRVFSPAEYGIIETDHDARGDRRHHRDARAELGRPAKLLRLHARAVGERRTVVLDRLSGRWLAWSAALCLGACYRSRAALERCSSGPTEYWDLIALAVAGLPARRSRSRTSRTSCDSSSSRAATSLVSFLLTGARRSRSSSGSSLVADEGSRRSTSAALLRRRSRCSSSWWLVAAHARADFSCPELRDDARRTRCRCCPSPQRLGDAVRGPVLRPALRVDRPRSASTASGCGCRTFSCSAVIAFGIAWAPFILDLHSRERGRHERVVRARAFTRSASGSVSGGLLSVWSREFFRTVTDPAFEDAYKVGRAPLGAVFALGLNGGDDDRDQHHPPDDVLRAVRGLRGRAQHRAQLPVDPAVRDGRRCRGDRSRPPPFSQLAVLPACATARPASFDLRAVLGALVLGGRPDRDRELDQPRPSG